MSVLKGMKMKDGLYEVKTIFGTTYILKEVEGKRTYKIFLKGTCIGEFETIKEILDHIANVEKFRRI